jgi:hypothetical protein
MLHGFRIVLTEPSKDIYCMESIHETKFFDNLNLLSRFPWLFEETLVFY